MERWFWLLCFFRYSKLEVAETSPNPVLEKRGISVDARGSIFRWYSCFLCFYSGEGMRPKKTSITELKVSSMFL
jgi:hypothetical protein